MDIRIVDFDETHLDWARQVLEANWKSTRVVTRGRLYEVERLPGYVAMVNNYPKGLLTYNIVGGECEVITLNSTWVNCGVGTSLLKAVFRTATFTGCSRLWLVTSNDNTPALNFYQKRGFRLVRVHLDSITHARTLKPEIPLRGVDDIPMRDELELEVLLQGQALESLFTKSKQ